MKHVQSHINARKPNSSGEIDRDKKIDDCDQISCENLVPLVADVGGDVGGAGNESSCGSITESDIDNISQSQSQMAIKLWKLPETRVFECNLGKNCQNGEL